MTILDVWCEIGPDGLLRVSFRAATPHDAPFVSLTLAHDLSSPTLGVPPPCLHLAAPQPPCGSGVSVYVHLLAVFLFFLYSLKVQQGASFSWGGDELHPQIGGALNPWSMCSTFQAMSGVIGRAVARSTTSSNQPEVRTNIWPVSNWGALSVGRGSGRASLRGSGMAVR